jgi:hypothetical protein
MGEQAQRIATFTDLDDSKMCYWYEPADGWYLYLPRCGAARLALHTVVEHEDGTITVTPSILTTGHDSGTKTTRHGYLTRGVWDEC